MAPKEIMGVTLPSTPPEDEPPMKRPRAPAQEAAPRSDTPTLNDWPVPSGKPAESRKDSPPGGMIRVEGKGWKFSMPHVALVAVLTSLAGVFGGKAISKGESAEVADVLVEVRALRKDVKGLKDDVDDLGKEQRSARAADKKILNYAEDSITPVVASLRRLGVKLGYDGDEDKAAEVEFHAAPAAGSTAPPIQPKAVLPERPSL